MEKAIKEIAEKTNIPITVCRAGMLLMAVSIRPKGGAPCEMVEKVVRHAQGLLDEYYGVQK